MMQSMQGFPHLVRCPQAFEQPSGDNSGFIHLVFHSRPLATSSRSTLVPSQIHMQTLCLPTGPIRHSGYPTGSDDGVAGISLLSFVETPVVPATIFSPGLTG